MAMAMRVVETKYGTIRGLPSGIPSVTVFKGVPYAAPPVGPLRWKEPQPVQPWEGVLDAYRFKAMSLQDKSGVANINLKDFCDYTSEEIGDLNSEDCLYLNIWTPAAKPDMNLPVMIWIHGGGLVEDYSFNLTVDGDDYAAKHNVILVSIEYRLGALGFLTHPDLTAESERHVSGNYGLLDQRFAIQWVKENISAFGGDPENITLFGESAGAFSINLHLCSPLNAGLFQKAILQSGGGYNGNHKGLMASVPLAEAEKQGVKAFEWLGVSSLEEARQLPAERFIEMQRQGAFAVSPVEDGYFLTKSTAEVFAANEHLQIPVIIGYTAEEGNLFKKQGVQLFAQSKEEFEASSRELYGEHLAERFFEIGGFYEDPDAMVGTLGDNSFASPILALCELEAQRKSAAPRYLYYFTRRPPGDDIGPAHAMDLIYTFDTIHRSWRPIEQKDLDVANAMTAYWSNFARSGDPNEEGLPVWTPYTVTNRKAMEIGEKIEMISGPGTPVQRFEVDHILGRYD